MSSREFLRDMLVILVWMQKITKLPLSLGSSATRHPNKDLWCCGYKLYYYDRRFLFNLQTEFYGIFDKIFNVRTILIFVILEVFNHPFSNRLLMSWEVFQENWDPFKDMRKLPRVQLSDQDMIIFCRLKWNTLLLHVVLQVMLQQTH